jgi:predicted phosphodiesterase
MPELTRVGESWILNPGSPTEKRRAPEHTMIVLEGGTPQLVSLDR